MKKYIARPLEEQLEELSGTPQEKVRKFMNIYYIYSQEATPTNVKKYIRTEKDPDYEVYGVIDDNNRENKGTVDCSVFYWETPIRTTPKTIGQFISVATALGRELFWEEDTYRNYIYINTKY